GLAARNSGASVPAAVTRSVEIAGITAQPIADQAIEEARTVPVPDARPRLPSASQFSAVAITDSGALTARAPVIEILDAGHARLTLDGQSVIVPLPSVTASITTAMIGGQAVSLVMGRNSPRGALEIDGAVRSFGLAPDLVNASVVPLVRGDLFPTLEVGHAGSVRLSSSGGQYTFGGSLSSLALRANGNPFLGADREGFLIGSDLDAAEGPVLSFERPDEAPVGGTHYDTMTVAAQ